MITFLYPGEFSHRINSSVSLDYITVACKTCGREHITFERDRHHLFRLPETITTDKNKKGEYHFHCVEECQVPPS